MNVNIPVCDLVLGHLRFLDVSLDPDLPLVNDILISTQCLREPRQRGVLVPLVLSCSIDPLTTKLTFPIAAFYYTFKFVLVLWMALPQTGGAQIVFRSVIQPLFARFFEGGSGTTASNLRAQAEGAGRKSM